MIRVFLIWCICLSGIVAQAQQKNLPLNYHLNTRIEDQLQTNNQSQHLGLKPFVQNHSISNEPSEMVFTDSMTVYYNAQEIFFTGHLFTIQGSNYHITIDPLFQFELGRDFKDTTGRKSTLINTRGIWVQGDLGNKVSFGTRFYENQAFYPDYLRGIIESRGVLRPSNNGYVRDDGVVPGMGRTKAFKGDGFDFAYASGYVSYSPIKQLNLQFGHGKHFVGYGYRSMLLSDNAFNYPYFRSTLGLFKNKLQYSVIYADMNHLKRLPEKTTPEAAFFGKAGSFHLLSYQASQKLQFLLFESVMWQTFDEHGSRPTPYQMFNPVMFLNSALLGLDANQNAMLGAAIRYSPVKDLSVYGQLAVDDPSNGRIGVQAGLKLLSPFKINNLTATFEFNKANPYTYSHDVVLQNYGHYNEALAHPLGAGFNEFVSILHYVHPSRLWATYKSVFAVYAEGGGGVNEGTNIYAPYYTRPANTGNFEQHNLVIQNLTIGYRLNVKTNMSLYAGLFWRKATNNSNSTETLWLTLGLEHN